jgi:hypothetical protein
VNLTGGEEEVPNGMIEEVPMSKQIGQESSPEVQLTPYYRFLRVVAIAVSVLLFLWIGVDFWYVLGSWTDLVLLCAGTVFFIGVWSYRRWMWLGFWCWLSWVIWSVIAGLACTIYWSHAMDQAVWVGEPAALVVARPFIAGFLPLMGLTSFLISARAIWPPQPKKQSAAVEKDEVDHH